MYRRDNLAIREHALRSSRGFEDVVRFVMSTIRMSLSSCKEQALAYNEKGLNSHFLNWKVKRKGYAYIEKHGAVLWGRIGEIIEREDKALDELYTVQNLAPIVKAMEIFLEVPFLGLVKSAFCCQLMGMNVSCLDVHNLRRLDEEVARSIASFNLKAKRETVRSKIVDYILLTQEMGAQYWWDTWCESIAGNIANRNLTDGERVSRFHVESIILKG